MPTAHSSPAELSAEAGPSELRRAVRDVRHLLWFRAATVRRPRAALAALVAMAALTVLAALAPAWIHLDRDLAPLLPAGLAALVVVGVGGAVAGAGGRELLARDPASIHPISPMTDHLGALLLAPLNTGWLIQTWALLGLSASIAGPGRLLAAQAVTLAWILAATTLGQAVAWAVECVRRGPRGLAIVRGVVGGLVALLALAGALPEGRRLLVGGPAGAVADVVASPRGLPVALALVLLVGAAVGWTVIGGRFAQLASRRMPRDEGRLETRTHEARPDPRSDLAVLRRIDRASVWRSVPLRRGTWLLAIAPGAVALAGGLDWSGLVLLPGLVASGCVLLFGVNLWCLDGRGMLWRETLPVAPRTVLLARACVLGEVLLGAGLVTVVLGAVRAGVPSFAELAGVVLALLVVVGQAVSAGLRWSAARPHAVDLRSARATPAPPLVMVGYSLRLAMATTFTSLLLGALAAGGRTDLLLAATAAFLLVSGLRVARAVRRWEDPVRRAVVVAVVAA
ncbi:hypothetical protein ASE01_14990 [Nocardioides sp. Root190]|uniref:hypothetical protein n=1 Tax=Nocardioides sp. Root190 TaxID=1736488 RepID=UPI0007007F43|nr:hypothetical protein [Nocardioides sp. Root190]KRB76304.1 hypothetical protein ASE01_14990 [Nocardioides sp. Root190]